ncbi:MAG: cation:proton antiporter [Alphaproteobacteria bacterium]|nr:cation:proton antiporter [Alphaproteobacteria bacterium]
MPEAAAPAAFREALIILGAAGAVIPMFYRLRVSPVLGFILVGMAVGPFGLGRLAPRFPALGVVTITDPESIAPVAEFGVVLLLFMIGLELSFERLRVMRRLVFGLGPAQVLLTAAALVALLLRLGLALPAAIAIATALAMSSTAIVLQVLGEQKQLGAPVGRAGVAVLLFQDLAVVPVLFALGALAPGEAAGLGRFGLAIVQAALAVLAIVAAGRLALRPLLRMAARTRSSEMFMAACLLVVMGTGLATAASGLSMAMGALIAGLLLAETEYRRQVEVTIDPFKGLLIGVFLISIGMGIDLARVAAQPLAIVGAAVALIALKLVLIAPLVRAFGVPWPAGVQAGLLLGPAGEFSFVVVGLARSLGLISPAVAGFALIVSALTMSAIPLLGWAGAKLGRRLERRRIGRPAMPLPPAAGAGRVVIAGFGRVGRTVAALLSAHSIPYIAIDRDPDRVGAEHAAGQPVYYGDITSPEWLRRLDLDTARALVVTLDDRAAIDAVVSAALQERDDLLIVARARDANHAAHLYGMGVADAVPETIEASLQLSEAVLVDVGVPMGPVIASIHEQRAEIQAQIKAMSPEAEIRVLGRRRLRDALPGKR